MDTRRNPADREVDPGENREQKGRTASLIIGLSGLSNV
jgi:hypothetical protein